MVTLEDRILDAAKHLCERWGRDKVTVDDIAEEARCSRATLYRLFPGGKDVLYEALRARETEIFFVELTAHLHGADTFEELIVRSVVESTRLLRADEHLRLMLASAPNEVASELTVEGLPRIVTVATEFLRPWYSTYVTDAEAQRLAEWLSRVVISYFLAPSAYVDLADETSATAFVRAFVLPAFSPQLTLTGR
jgi:AcrR family transcriptional regulator